MWTKKYRDGGNDGVMIARITTGRLRDMNGTTTAGFGKNATRVLSTLVVLMIVVFATVPAALASFAPRMVVDVDSGRVLAHQDAFQRWYPASLTKLMTAYVAFRAVKAGEMTLQSPVTVSKNAAAEPPSKMYFAPGSTLTLDAALKIIMVKSANDVATAIGESVAGSENAFIARMNDEAARLGMTGTRFVNAHGLPGGGQYTNARDMAVLAVALRREFPQYASYFALEGIRSGDRTYRNFNLLIGRYRGADGMKTGFICSAGFNQVSSATRSGRTVVVVVLGAASLRDRAEESARLLEEGLKASGRGKPTLANLRPYGENPDRLIDLRPVICTAEARAERASERGQNGIIMRSPLLREPDRPTRYVEANLGGAVGTARIDPAVPALSRVPIPVRRPDDAVIAVAATTSPMTTGFDVTEARARPDTSAGPRAGAVNTQPDRQAATVPIPVPRPQR